MNLREFLQTWTTVNDLKGILYSLNQPLSGTKDVLISRVEKIPRISAIKILVLLDNATLQNVLGGNRLPTSGRKSELVIRLIKSKVVIIVEEDVLSFLEAASRDEFSSFLELLSCLATVSEFDRAAKLLPKASENQLRPFSRLFQSSGNPGGSASSLVSMLLERSRDAPCFAACVLEDLIESGGTVAPVALIVKSRSDEIMARHRRILRSFARHPRLLHPAVDSLLQQIWSGEVSHRSELLQDVRREVRTEANRLEGALNDPRQARTLHDVSQRTARIESKTDDIRRGMKALQDRLAVIQTEIEASPERVARALEELSTTKEVKWGTRRKIKHDLQKFWNLTDRAQKIEFLGRSIITYGPIVISALKGIL